MACFRHPWIAGPSMKRKHSFDDSPTKRPRFSTNIECTLSNLSLNSTAPPDNNDPPSPPNAVDVSELLPDDIIPVDAQLPDSVEEPIHDVKMNKSTWYEPEPDRIVVTDLDSSDDEEDDEQDTTLSISPALIDRIRNRQLSSTLPTPTTHALVLYQPQPQPEPPADDDAMDVEY
ncbi:uncharacterized protein EV420DRAFT_1267231 [Desarmillaria tabescens]|uniref:Uncharacterized protein n=1 Tax=Armillaria tabescens TaxID=1929756 RepID=A0AA39N9D1_ARMTA|nr:uncharacterized protein EV420DRAFT_1267231 [Desarmillaria tabescens]KAK0461424.1 hypothetical protein EV420DRAFT_1267231 [Desarmillaria tabescens]